MKTEHNCNKLGAVYRDIKERCVTQHYAHGEAFSNTFVNYGDSEYFWTDNNEYTNPILFCPYCGLDLRTLLIKQQD